MPTDQTAVLEAMRNDLSQIKSSLNQDRLFNILEIMRDEVNDLTNQIDGVRADIRDLRNLVFQQSSTAAD
ncbi:hypothetical protein [Marinimicrobium agarilyticum]|uniref:hypothetical protein n=1 Tax=Marinimicrobium agarilyticum TaxID=306546 RepID=UPI00041DA5C2|nr:hypothetical protein [Marinimicrobium agarilyticum]